MKKLKLVSLLILLVSVNLFAQESDGLKTRKAQVTFAYPLGSNGMNSIEYSNNFSFNLLYGLNGGVSGVEIGSVINYNKGNVKGFQLAGVSNINTGTSKGLLLSGVSNTSMNSSSGIFISGVLNHSRQNSTGFQLSTVNLSESGFKGAQLGVFNSAKEVKGVQLGVFNSARKLNGVQLGVFNYMSDDADAEALPIGIFSIVKNGHFELELTGGEVIYSNLNYKMGVERFYTIYKAGFSSYNNHPVYTSGLGFGGNISMSEKHKISIDVSANSIVYNNNFDGELNLLNKADFNYKYNISEKLSLLVGPSFNVYVTKEKVNGEYGTLDIPYSMYTNEWSGGKLFMWVGINAGLSLTL